MSESKFTKETTTKLIELASKGLPRRTIASIAGISAQTLSSWLKKGERGQEPYTDFYTDFISAEGRKEQQLVADLLDQSELDPKLLQWFLSVRYRESYGNQIKVDATVETKTEAVDEILNKLQDRLPEDLFERVIAALESD